MDEDLQGQMPGNEQLHEAKDAGTLAEIAGRLCYWSFKKPRPGGHAAYMARIIEEGHGSILEHAHFNFIITGVSRTFSHELVRHRLASYSQLSQRYFEETECAFICPPKTLRNARWFDRWLDVMDKCYESYLIQIDDMRAEGNTIDEDPIPSRDLRKAILGEARSMLPNAIETKVVLSANARCIRGILDQRASKHADQEIRRVAYKLYDLVYGQAPSLFADYQKEEHPWYGTTVTTPHKKV